VTNAGSGGHRAVLWDFGGVILSSPFEAFNRFEAERGLPLDSIRRVNATNPHENAWARFERSDIGPTEFDDAFARDAAALGLEIRGAEVLALLRGDIRPEIVRALDLVREAGFLTACLTNNMTGGDGHADRPIDHREQNINAIMERFDAVVESSKVGVRKPEPRFYEIACELLAVRPHECVFLDDLGINLKPAAAMGMRTIKVLSAEQAIADLESVLGLSLR
jgi:putative hydrolase of the HAD superfamily